MDTYKVYFTVPLPTGTDHHVWFRAKGTLTWHQGNPNDQRIQARLESIDANSATFSAFVYYIRTNLLGQQINQWYPASLQQTKLAYTVAYDSTPPLQPFTVTIDGPDFTDPRFQPAPTFTATPAHGTAPFAYAWRYRLPGETTWHYGSTSDTYTHYPYSGGGHTIEVTVTDAANLTATDTSYLSVYECPPGDPGDPGLECPTLAPERAGAALAQEALPEAYALHAPVPNPLSERGVIGYALPEAARVRLTLHDALGREVARLVDAAVSAGRHTALLEASSLPSGVYLYRLEATGASGTFHATGRLTVVR